MCRNSQNALNGIKGEPIHPAHTRAHIYTNLPITVTCKAVLGVSLLVNQLLDSTSLMNAHAYQKRNLYIRSTNDSAEIRYRLIWATPQWSQKHLESRMWRDLHLAMLSGGLKYRCNENCWTPHCNLPRDSHQIWKVYKCVASNQCKVLLFFCVYHDIFHQEQIYD